METNRVKLGEIAKIKNGFAFKGKDFIDDGIPVIKIKNIKPNQILLDDLGYVSPDTIIGKDKYKIEYGDIIITMTGNRIDGSPDSWVGKVAVFNQFGDYYLNQRLAIIDVDPEKANPNYIAYLLSSWEYQLYYIKRATSSGGQANISPQTVSDTLIDLPPREIQDKIAYIISTINEKIKNNDEYYSDLQQYINALFIKWFVDFEYLNEDDKLYCGKMKSSELGDIPENWCVKAFKDIVLFSNGYGFKSSELLDEEKEDTYKVFKMGNINKCGGINKSKTKSWVSKKDIYNKYLLKKGDILMCMTDMKNSGTPLLGHTALMDKDDEFVVNQRVGLIRPKNKEIDYPFIYTLTNLDFFINDLRSRANSGVQVNLSTKEIEATRFICPSLDLIKKFNNIGYTVYDKMFSLLDENENLVRFRDTIFNKLLSGEINIDNLNYKGD